MHLEFLEQFRKLGFCFRPSVTATDTGPLLAWAVAVRTPGKYRAAEDEAQPHKTGAQRNALCALGMNLVSLEKS